MSGLPGMIDPAALRKNDNEAYRVAAALNVFSDTAFSELP
jgi:hypothetical protein